MVFSRSPSSKRQIDHFLRLEEFLLEKFVERSNLGRFSKRLRLLLQFATLKANEAVGQAIELLAADRFANYLYEVGQRHNGSRHNEVELLLHLLGTAPLCRYVLQPQSTRHLLAHPYLLANGVNQMEPNLRKHDGKRNARKAAARTEVHNARAGFEANQFGNGKAVQNMMFVEVVDVLARDDVNLAVPVAIKRIEGSKLLLLPLGQRRKVFGNNLVVHVCIIDVC